MSRLRVAIAEEVDRPWSEVKVAPAVTENLLFAGDGERANFGERYAFLPVCTYIFFVDRRIVKNNLNLLKNFEFTLFLLSNFLLSSFYDIPYVILPQYANEKLG